MKKKFFGISSALLLTPFITFAQVAAGGKLSQTTEIFRSLYTIVKIYLIPIAFLLALLYFFYGMAKYIKSEGDGKAEGKSIMTWGVVALFVMTCIWGLVYFIADEFGVDAGEDQMTIPSINTSGRTE